MLNEKPFKFKFFLPKARLLNQIEIDQLPADKHRAAGATDTDGLWVEINCPDRSCLDTDGRITLPTQESKAKAFSSTCSARRGSVKLLRAQTFPSWKMAVQEISKSAFRRSKWIRGIRAHRRFPHHLAGCLAKF
jgi:hypothetical protein